MPNMNINVKASFVSMATTSFRENGNHAALASHSIACPILYHVGRLNGRLFILSKEVSLVALFTQEKFDNIKDSPHLWGYIAESAGALF